jgi:hypothetical protein
MTVLPEPPGAVRPGAARPVRALDLGPAAIAASLAVAGGTALLGLLAGYGWSVLAPRAQLVMISRGAAGLTQVETSAFIAADAVFCLLMVAGGVISGGLGYLLAVRRHGPLAMAGVLAGALAAAYLARWVGERSGLATFHHLLATLPAGAHLHDALTLGATGALAFWPLAAGLMAGGLAALAPGSRGEPAASSEAAVAGGHRMPARGTSYTGENGH